MYSEKGVEEIEAPFYGTSIAGTKRVAVALEDTVFVNVFSALLIVFFILKGG